MFINPKETELKKLLQDCHNIAVVGLSSNPIHTSYTVAKYLQDHGYRVIPVNPTLKEAVLGEKPYPALEAVPEKVDIVNVFRRSEDVPPIAQAALQVKPKAIWMQLGVVNEAAAAEAVKENILVVMDRCIKLTHCSLLGTDEKSA
ncbi:MAG: hypothetical protein A4E53_03040 [Pelotomaculum sp. PtaB.Bin104]|nr:MAG: hypothetical protein A4E53_03040 [Pelotomaculum sp. PtaB.Bin104]